jgi:hypothetical protein
LSEKTELLPKALKALFEPQPTLFKIPHMTPLMTNEQDAMNGMNEMT